MRVDDVAGNICQALAPGWVNFALHSAHAEKVTLCLQWAHGDEGEEPEVGWCRLTPGSREVDPRLTQIDRRYTGLTTLGFHA